MLKNTLLVLSVKPLYAKKIFTGEKNIELRKSKPKKIRKGSYVLVYASSPVKEIYGVCIVDKIDELPIQTFTSNILKEACIDKEYLNNYYEGYDNGTIIHLGRRWKLNKEINMDNFIAPQSYRYATDYERNIVFG